MALSRTAFASSQWSPPPGRTYMLPGAVHLVIFAVFLFLSWVP